MTTVGFVSGPILAHLEVYNADEPIKLQFLELSRWCSVANQRFYMCGKAGMGQSSEREAEREPYPLSVAEMAGWWGV